MEGTNGKDGDRRRLQFNVVQLSAGALAAVSAAVAASFLGVAGTLIGAAVSSVLTSSAASIYSHYLDRTHDRLRRTRTAELLKVRGAAMLAQPTYPRAVPAESHTESPTESPAEGEAANQGGGDRATGPGTATGSGFPWRRWVPVAASSLAVFLTAMVLITGYEAATGTPLASKVRGERSSGTSLGQLVNSDQGSTGKKQTTPTDSPTSTSDETGKPSGEPSPGESSSPAPGDTASPGGPDQQPNAPATSTPGNGGAPQNQQNQQNQPDSTGQPRVNQGMDGSTGS